MEIIVLYGLSVLTSLAMEAFYILRIIKDVAAEGYKVDFTNMKHNKEENPKSNNSKKKVQVPTLLIPGVNILRQMQIGMEYINKRDEILMGMGMLKEVKEMSKEEKKLYNENPNSLMAFMINLYPTPEIEKIEENVEDGLIIKFLDGKLKGSKVYFEYEDDLKILGTKGPISKLSEKDQLIETKSLLLKCTLDEELEAHLKSGEVYITIPTKEEIKTLTLTKDIKKK